MPKILVADPIGAEGVELLQTRATVDVKTGMKPEELLAVIADYDGLVVRSETKVTKEVIEAAKNLKVIGRAGIGVDNIDLEAATNAGIAVVNAPTGNTVAAAEHTMALMLALSRNVPTAHQSLKSGEWKRSQFMGIEVRNKTLGVCGLGRVGSEVARRAQSFDMRLVGYDPFVSPEHAKSMGIELLSLEELLGQSDFITLHTPLTDSTRHMIGPKEVGLLKRGARLINVARGELVDEAAIIDGLNSGQLGGVALDVFAQEPPQNTALVGHPKVVVTPHLGASTEEAQREVAIEASEQVLAVLNGERARNTVNAPSVAPEVHAVLAPYMPVATVVGKLLTHLAQGQFLGITISYEGEIAEHDTRSLQAAVLAGLLEPITTGQVNLINAPVLARERGINITEQHNTASREYSSIVSATVETSEGKITLAGTSLRNEPHIVKIDDYWLDIVPTTPYMLFVDNQDQPGSIGAVGTIAGKHNINISFMEVGRLKLRGRAMMVLGLDDNVPPDVMEEIRDLGHIYNVRLAHLGSL
ncbi:MAG: phosphoglycerate dehydrogenase [Chloroflexi bacterium]|nr:phosphoglycerate dehydrogenase [Chloroflexota bacterium]MDA1271424.1 phosphoglycerate dehydrogenase [Chloroflexota bacterium]PKB58963.1 MAG: phosphoglycerate dehydrogenase [SAR202 cluster bacterium Casp-Chloro-G2]